MGNYYTKIKRDRMDEEDAIMDCWRIVDDINFVWTQIMDSPDEMDKDEICNILLGMEQMYNRKFSELFETFTQAHQLNGNSAAKET